MNSERIKAIQEQTAYPQSRSVKQALHQVWNECQQEYNSQTESLKKEIEELKSQIEKHNSQYCKCDVPDRDSGYTYCHACKKNVSDERMDEILKNQ